MNKVWILIFIFFSFSFSSPMIASDVCPHNQNGGILQTQHVTGWWGKCTKEYLLHKEKKTDGFFIIDYYVLSPQDTSDKITISYYDVATPAKDITLTRSNVRLIKKDDVDGIQSWLDKITRVIPVRFLKVKNLDEADMVITLLDMPYWSDQLGGIADRVYPIRTEKKQVFAFFNFAADSGLYTDIFRENELKALFYHEIGHVLGLKEVWDNSRAVDCQTGEKKAPMACYGDYKKRFSSEKNPFHSQTLYTYADNPESLPTPVFFTPFDVAALQKIWGHNVHR